MNILDKSFDAFSNFSLSHTHAHTLLPYNLVACECLAEHRYKRTVP